jgi:hypothetical protein
MVAFESHRDSRLGVLKDSSVAQFLNWHEINLDYIGHLPLATPCGLVVGDFEAVERLVVATFPANCKGSRLQSGG